MEEEPRISREHRVLREDNEMEDEYEFKNFHPKYKPYEIQKQYIRTVKRALKGNSNAIIESPTGTGKSLCLLYSTISWLESNEGLKAQEAISTNPTSAGDKIQIIFCSRTHSQLMQVENELKKIYFEPTMAILASRDYLCINEDLNDFSSSEKKKGCTSMKTQYKKNLQRKKPPPPPMRNIECGYSKLSEENYIVLKPKKAPDDWKNKVYDIEEVKEMGLKHDFCPYYLPYKLKDVAKIVFMPYNYLLFEDMVDNYKDLIKNSIIIFDEAHNVPSVACDGRTFSLKYSAFTKVIKELKTLKEAKNESEEKKELYITSREFSSEIERALSLIYELKLEVENVFYIERDKIKIKEKEKGSKNEYESSSNFSTKIEKDIIPFCEELFRDDKEEIRTFKQQVYDLEEAYKDNPTLRYSDIKEPFQFLFKCLSLWQKYLNNENKDSDINHYILCIYVKNNEIDEIKMACLSPHLAFKTLKSYSPRSFIITSGTLGNFDFWRTGLRIPFIYELENDPIIDKERVLLNYVTTGKSKREFSFTQANRESNIPFEDLYHFLYFLGDEIPFGGILVLFPSSKVMKAFIEILEKNGKEKWKELSEKRRIFTEEKVSNRNNNQNMKNNSNTTENRQETLTVESQLPNSLDATDKKEQDSVQEQLQKYKNYIQKGNKANEENKRNKGNAENKGNKAFLFCYCYGNFSEGLDLRDDECRAVVVVGVPRINCGDAIVKGRMEYLDQKKRENIEHQSGQEWYDNTAMIAVNQGIGRVVRHKDDYGMIFLVDREYRHSKFKNLISKWAKRNTKIINRHEDLQKEGIKEFFLRRRNAQ